MFDRKDRGKRRCSASKEKGFRGEENSLKEGLDGSPSKTRKKKKKPSS